MWRGLAVAPEDRCSEYASSDYRYSPSVEPRIVDAQGGIYGPYTGTWFNSIRDTDIEHIVARSEAHDSGLCAADPETRDRFASDILNLTLASLSVNRHQKVAKDPNEWLPDLNQCWYVDRVVQVRRKYQLTINQAEAEAIDRVLAGCESTEMVFLAQGASTTTAATPTPTEAPEMDALAMYDDNGNGRITCAEALAHGIAPVRRGHPAYEFMRDADGDGVVCELDGTESRRAAPTKGHIRYYERDTRAQGRHLCRIFSSPQYPTSSGTPPTPCSETCTSAESTGTSSCP